MKRALLIDTDPGVDDALALFFAAGSECAKLSKVTSCFGNASLEVVTRNAQFLLSTMALEGIELSAGASQPWAQDPLTSFVHGPGGLGEIQVPTGSQASFPPISSTPAVDAIINFLEQPYASAKSIVAIAPLSNIAAALQRNAAAFNNAERIVILGGTVLAPGNKSAVAEFNFRSDPEAADYVFEHCPCEIMLVPLDICYRAVLTLDNLKLVRDQKFLSFLYSLCGLYSAANGDEEGIEGIIMYDPLAVFCALYPELCTMSSYAVRVDTGDSFARGASIVDRRPRSTAVKNTQIVQNLDMRVMSEYFFEALNNLIFNQSAVI